VNRLEDDFGLAQERGMIQAPIDAYAFRSVAIVRLHESLWSRSCGAFVAIHASPLLYNCIRKNGRAIAQAFMEHWSCKID
jgi:hypothetical protein